MGKRKSKRKKTLDPFKVDQAPAIDHEARSLRARTQLRDKRGKFIRSKAK